MSEELKKLTLQHVIEISKDFTFEIMAVFHIFYLSPVRMAKINRTNDIPHW